MLDVLYEVIIIPYFSAFNYENKSACCIIFSGRKYEIPYLSAGSILNRLASNTVLLSSGIIDE